MENLYTLAELSSNQCMHVNEEQDWLWHKRLGHIGFENLAKLLRKNAVRNLPSIKKSKNHICEACQKEKQTRSRYSEMEHNTRRPLDILHLDLCGPTRNKGFNGERYFMVMVDDYSRMTWIALLRKKDEAFKHFVAFKEIIENAMSRRIKSIRTDRGGEFISDKMTYYCMKHGI